MNEQEKAEVLDRLEALVKADEEGILILPAAASTDFGSPDVPWEILDSNGYELGKGSTMAEAIMSAGKAKDG